MTDSRREMVVDVLGEERTPGSHSSAGGDFYCRLWSSPKWSSQEPNPREAELSGVVEELALRSPAPRPPVLDVGCGRGWMTHLLARRFGEAMGIDPATGSIEAARELFPTLQFRRATTGDLLEEGLAGRFDLIVSSEVLEHVPYPSQPSFLRELRDLLSPKGHLILTTPRGELLARMKRLGGARQPIEDWVSESQLDELCHASGLVTVARARAVLYRVPLNWQGWIVKFIYNRRWVRSWPLLLRARLNHAAKLCQIRMVRRGDSQS